VLELTLRIAFSLLVVFGLMWGLARLARRPLGARRGTATLSVVARQQLSRSASVAVVRLNDRALVLGVTDGQVNLLTETDLAALVEPTAAPVPAPVPAPTRVFAPDAVREPVDLPAERVIRPDRLAGSALSPATWRQTLDFLRDRTARR
jgi:flagellar protein FliO/FliZ